MKKTRAKAFGAKLALCALLAASVIAWSGCSNGDDDDDDGSSPVTLSQQINNGAGEVDLKNAKYNEDVTITRACTISNADFGGKKITATVSGITLKNIKNAVVEAGTGIGTGDLSIEGSDITTLTVLGGGSNSIHVKGTKVTTANLKKADVRLVLEGDTTVTAVTVSANNVAIESATTAATITTLTVEKAVASISLAGGTVKTITLEANGEKAATITLTAATTIEKLESAVAVTVQATEAAQASAEAVKKATTAAVTVEKVEKKDTDTSEPGEKKDSDTSGESTSISGSEYAFEVNDRNFTLTSVDGTIDAISVATNGTITAKESFFIKTPVENGNYKVTLTTNVTSVISECITEPVEYHFKNNEGTVITNNGKFSPNPWTPPKAENGQPMFGITKKITSGTPFEVAVCDKVLDLEFVYSNTPITLTKVTIEKLEYSAREKPYLIALGDSTTAQGDHTMSNEAGNLSKNYISWASCISNGYLDTELAAAGLGGIVNCAQSGGTVGTIYDDGRIEMLLLNVHPGDYVSINIGINTSKEVTVGGQKMTIGTLDTEAPIISKYVIEAVKDRDGIPYITTITPQGPTSDNDSGVWLTEDTKAVAYTANQRARGDTYGTAFDVWGATGKAYYAGKEYAVGDTVPAYTWTNGRHTGEYCMVLVEVANYYDLPVVDFGVYGERYMNEHYANADGCKTVRSELYNDKHHYKRAWGEILGKYMLECVTKMQEGTYSYPFADYLPNFYYIPAAVSDISLPETETLEINEIKTLTATIVPSNAANKNVSWESSDSAVATVDENGKVTGVSAGTATITVTTEDGGKTATSTVIVTPPDPSVLFKQNFEAVEDITNVVEKGYNATLELGTNKTNYLKATQNGSGARYVSMPITTAANGYTVTFDLLLKGGNAASASTNQTAQFALGTSSTKAVSETGYIFSLFNEQVSKANVFNPTWYVGHSKDGKEITLDTNTTYHFVITVAKDGSVKATIENGDTKVLNEQAITPTAATSKITHINMICGRAYGEYDLDNIVVKALE